MRNAGEINQEICRKFVHENVYACMTTMVDYILIKSYEDSDTPFNHEEIDNYYIYESYDGITCCFNGGTEEDLDDFIQNLELDKDGIEYEIRKLEDKKFELTENISQFQEVDGREDEIEEAEEEISSLEEAIEDLEEEIINIERDIDDLSRLDQEPQEIFEWWMVSNFLARKLRKKGQPVIMGEQLWGRTCSGQAIYMDSVMMEICGDLEILHGQKNCEVNE